MTSTALAAVHRAQPLDRLYLAADAAFLSWKRCIAARDLTGAIDAYEAYRQAKTAYETYRGMCTAAPLDPLLPSAEEEEP